MEDVIALLDARPCSMSTLAFLVAPARPHAAHGWNLQEAAGHGKRPKGHFQRLELVRVLQLALLVHRQEVEERPCNNDVRLWSALRGLRKVAAKVHTALWAPTGDREQHAVAALLRGIVPSIRRGFRHVPVFVSVAPLSPNPVRPTNPWRPTNPHAL
jgi:hypothetical protein